MRRLILFFLPRRSIAAKLHAIVMLCVTAALGLASTAIGLYEFAGQRAWLSREMSTQAQIIASNSTAALSFNDRDSAAELLRGLKAESSIVAARLILPDGRDIAEFVRAGGSPRWIRLTPGSFGCWLAQGRLVVFQPIVLGGANDRDSLPGIGPHGDVCSSVPVRRPQHRSAGGRGIAGVRHGHPAEARDLGSDSQSRPSHRRRAA
jgi:Periplasmic sensor domain